MVRATRWLLNRQSKSSRQFLSALGSASRARCANELRRRFGPCYPASRETGRAGNERRAELAPRTIVQSGATATGTFRHVGGNGSPDGTVDGTVSGNKPELHNEAQFKL